jgi:hypothetical protein
LSGPETFTKQRFEQRIDEIVDLATHDPDGARRQARRFLDWLAANYRLPTPEVEAAMEDLRSLLELLGGAG